MNALAFTTQDVARFLAYVDKLPCGCWYWLGARSKGKGKKKFYGSFRVAGKTVRAHRFALFALAGKECPAGLHRDHLCGFTMCVNPAHLEIVTPLVNERRKRARKA